MNEKPGISIVVPSLQHGPFIETTLRSLLAQTYTPLEILVMDGGSTDETKEVLLRYEKRIHWQSQPDKGQADAINRGFHRASGEILGWLNSDDLLAPGALERVAVLFQHSPSVDVIYGHCVFVDRDGQFQRYFSEIRPFDSHALANEINFIAQPACFFRRRAWEAVAGLDTNLHYVMDWDLWCHMAKDGMRFHFLPEVLAAARMYSETKTSRGGWSRLREILKINRRYGTGILPRAFLFHFYSDYLKDHRWIHALRRLRTLLGGKAENAAAGETPGSRIILGCIPHSQDAVLPCRMHFPWHKPLAEIFLKITIGSPLAPGQVLKVMFNDTLLPLLTESRMANHPEMIFQQAFPERPLTDSIAIDIKASPPDLAHPIRIRFNQWRVS